MLEVTIGNWLINSQMNCMLRNEKVTVNIFCIANYSIKQLLNVICPENALRKISRIQLQNSSGRIELINRYYYRRCEGVSRVAEFSSRAEETTAVPRNNLSHVASGHRRCVIHERGINRKLKIVITRGFKSLTVISTDIYCPTFPSCENSKKTVEEKYLCISVCLSLLLECIQTNNALLDPRIIL